MCSCPCEKSFHNIKVVKNFGVNTVAYCFVGHVRHVKLVGKLFFTKAVFFTNQ